MTNQIFKKKVRLVPIYVEIFFTILCTKLSYSYPPSLSREKGGCHRPNQGWLRLKNPIHRGPRLYLERPAQAIWAPLVGVDQWWPWFWPTLTPPVSTGVQTRTVELIAQVMRFVSQAFDLQGFSGGRAGRADFLGAGGRERKRGLFLGYSFRSPITGDSFLKSIGRYPSSRRIFPAIRSAATWCRSSSCCRGWR